MDHFDMPAEDFPRLLVEMVHRRDLGVWDLVFLGLPHDFSLLFQDTLTLSLGFSFDSFSFASGLILDFLLFF